jgi:serine phosphatase RsbU (regulator of sigma subunit)
MRAVNQLDIERGRHTGDCAVAATLQGSLLPTVTDLPGVSTAARYLVSRSAARVGGDWYDLFVLPDGAIGVAIGDVMGHDVIAAAAMYRIRWCRTW